METKGQGIVFVISAPSGAGKTSLIKALLQKTKGVEMSVSHTTRPKRASEIDGKDYHFISENDFNQKVEADGFVEHAHVFSYHYGTSKSEIERVTAQGKDVILEIDWQGAKQVRELFPEQVASIFILPPSQAALLDRLQKRKQDDEAVISKRMAAAKNEISHFSEYDYNIINDDFDSACDALQGIIVAERLKRAVEAKNHRQWVAELMN